MKAPFLIGRLSFGGFFLYSGINDLRNRCQMAPYAEGKDVPKPEAAIMLSGVPLIVGWSQYSAWGKAQIRCRDDSWIPRWSLSHHARLLAQPRPQQVSSQG